MPEYSLRRTLISSFVAPLCCATACGARKEQLADFSARLRSPRLVPIISGKTSSYALLSVVRVDVIAVRVENDGQYSAPPFAKTRRILRVLRLESRVSCPQRRFWPKCLY